MTMTMLSEESGALSALSPHVAAARTRSTILYIGDTVGERGREWTNVTRQADGRRTIRATCEIDDSGVLRDVVYTVDAAWRPLEAFVRIEIKGEHLGSSWFRFDGNEATCEGYSDVMGRVSQQMTLSAPPAAFGTHPLSCDMWFLPAFDFARSKEVQDLKNVLVCSTLANGGSSPVLQRWRDPLPVQFVGDEKISVPAGTFDVHHFRFVWPDRPPQELWCTPGDYAFVKARSNQLASDYVLTKREA